MNDRAFPKQNKIWIFCNKCRTETNHILIAEHEHRYEDTTDDKYVGPSHWWEEIRYRFLFCAGCERALIEEMYKGSAIEGFPDEPPYNISYYPERTKHSLEGKHFIQLPRKLSQIYRESVQAYNNRLFVLCAAGLRALIEGICKDKDITGRDLEKRINGLTAHLPQNIVDNLHSLRFMGNEAVHELSSPDEHELEIAIEICEDLLNFLYDLDYKTKMLASSRERRKPK